MCTLCLSLVAAALLSAADPVAAPSEAATQSAANYSATHGGQTMVVLFNGQRVFERYDNGGAVDKLQGLVSGVKSFVGVAAVAAVQAGIIRLDNPASENIPEWRNDSVKAKITYRQLLNMTSGLMPLERSGAAKSAAWPAWKEIARQPMAYKPGERFQYGEYQLNLFAYALERKLDNETFEHYLSRRILEPLGVKLQWQLRCEDGHPQVGGGGTMIARDWATFGEFVRRKGDWNGRQFIDANLLAECFQGTPQNPAYGLTWWLKQPVADQLVRQIPLLSEEWGAVVNADWLPGDLAAAFGGGKQRLYVIPSQKLVIVRQGSNSHGFAETEFLSRLLRGKAMTMSAVLAMVPANDGPTTSKHETFDRDPDWEAHNNHIKPEVVKPLEQDFDYSSSTNFAGKAKGEIGGTIWRAPNRASYAAKIPQKTLNDKLSASGVFALSASSGSSGAFFGWFDSDMPGDGRQSNLGIHFAGQGEGARLTLRLVTAKNQSCGTKVTEWEVIKKGEKIRPPSIKNDGTRYTWRLDYDPAANNGDGQMEFTMTSDAEKKDEFEGKLFKVPLPKGYKGQGTKFDRFGLMNTMKPGNSLVLHFDDLMHDGKTEDFSKDPGWIGVGNHVGKPNREWGGAHDFGFSAETHYAGGSPGELGGLVWRSGLYAYYADRVGPLSMNERLEASGKVVLNVGPPDSGIYFGWFNGKEKEFSPSQAGNFVGVKIGGPTKVGHYFLPSYATAKTTPIERVGVRQHAQTVSIDKGTGPVFVPQKVFAWKIVYDPSGNGGKGTIEATLGDDSTTLNLNDGDKAKGALLDRFGIFTTHRGGSFVRIYFDDLTYTATAPGR